MCPILICVVVVFVALEDGEGAASHETDYHLQQKININKYRYTNEFSKEYSLYTCISC